MSRRRQDDCCTLANNHVLDWGRAGLLETLKTLQKLDIKVAGAGRNADEARAPALLNASDRSGSRLTLGPSPVAAQSTAYRQGRRFDRSRAFVASPETNRGLS
ncbi:CapA family protein [Bradyrhizobium japonicum]|uniref:CapA family protein n=1 Tax=Bradyrhizobium japonicum TaxID=375 RepID=UPI0009B6B572